MGLETATGGGIELGDKNIAVLPVRSRRPELLRSLQMVFQNLEGTQPRPTASVMPSRVSSNDLVSRKIDAGSATR